MKEHPGQILLQRFLKPRKITQKAFAQAVKIKPVRLSEIIRGNKSLTVYTAVKLALYFENSPEYWLKLQFEYDIDKSFEIFEIWKSKQATQQGKETDG